MAFNWADITNPSQAARTPWNWAAVSNPSPAAKTPFNWAAVSAPQTGARAAAPVAPAPKPNVQRKTLDEVLFGGGAPDMPQGPSAEEQAQDFIQNMLQLAYGGGGGADLSGFQGLIDDINARRDALNIRKWQQRQFLTDLFDAAEARATADRAGIATTVEGQLASDAKRRADEVSLIRGEEAARRQVADAARGALGVNPGADLSSAVSQNVVGGVGAMGSVADRDARIRQSIAEQQLGREIAGLAPLEAMSVSDLMSQYEDRLAALASERAGIKAQMAQARASAGRGGPSLSELLSLQQAANEQFGLGGAGVELPGIVQTAQGIQSLGPIGNDLIAIGDRIISSWAASPTTMKPLSTQEMLSQLAANDPAVSSLLRSYPSAAGIIVNYVNEALKG